MSGITLRSAVATLLTLLATAAALPAQGASHLSIAVGPPAAGWRAFVRVNGVLDDPALREALGSGLPVRFRFRLELWEKAVLDRLVGVEEALLTLLQDPLERTYTLVHADANHSFASLVDAERGITRELPANPRPPPRRAGRYYYLATLEVETLSLSDLEELQRWLRGEARPAVQGRGSLRRALGRGVQRAFVRMIGLPTRRYEARSPTFEVSA